MLGLLITAIVSCHISSVYANTSVKLIVPDGRPLTSALCTSIYLTKHVLLNHNINSIGHVPIAPRRYTSAPGSSGLFAHPPYLRTPPSRLPASLTFMAIVLAHAFIAVSMSWSSSQCILIIPSRISLCVWIAGMCCDAPVAPLSIFSAVG